MSTEITLPAAFAARPPALANMPVSDELGAGITAGYAVMGYRGKVWAVKYQGTENALMREDGDGPKGSIDVVIVKAAPVVAKIFYKDGWQDGSTDAPHCFSNNGVTPDPTAREKQSAACASCPKNAWGSRVTDAGKAAKACADSKRLVIVPDGDFDNEMFGGPMLLRCPAASLKALKSYSDLMSSYQFPFYGVVTKISFDAKESYPSFVFQAVRPLSEAEAQTILKLREDPRVARILNENEQHAPEVPAAPAVPASPFLNGAPVAQPQVAPAQPAPAAPTAPAAPVQQAPAPTPAPAPAPAPAVAATKPATAGGLGRPKAVTRQRTAPAAVTAPPPAPPVQPVQPAAVAPTPAPAPVAPTPIAPAPQPAATVAATAEAPAAPPAGFEALLDSLVTPQA